MHDTLPEAVVAAHNVRVNEDGSNVVVYKQPDGKEVLVTVAVVGEGTAGIGAGAATASALAALASSSIANPIPANEPRGSPLITDDILLFDAPALQSGAGSDMTASVRMFSFVRQIDSGVVSSVVTKAIEAFGVEIGNKANNVLERTKLFLAIPRSEISVDLKVSTCNSISVGKTSDGGLLEQSAALGACDGSLTPKNISGSVPRIFNSKQFSATLFPSGPSGFGVVSDVDDTIKVSNVLDRTKAVQSLLVDDHQAVSGMPELYSKVNGALSNPAWFYLSGSPYQLYPSLRKFIFATYPNGPMIVQNLTVTDISSVLDFITNPNNVKDYKIAQMEKIYSFYPQKKFLTVGDSTQADPEVYAEIFRRHPEFIQCIWIRQVQGANNTAERFASAFQGVPQNKWKVFSDPAEVTNLDVANGKCN
ncbi:hypothetical protein H072_9885 [Dactylellina haptotyla CBS 200.50]|uniref:Phosphatidate phosphatase APP1 catalytic domain-containing protein n=1 Tax=Dactylellina haptotyla (strain CBS 200.50) TaxID=1284197 RepID=S8A1P6_DACHA|nr:hypothetical protein H072_9885 [Dactylellina haptotyla CBS 200.50]